MGIVNFLTVPPLLRQSLHKGIKLHAQYCAPRSWAKARAHEVFAHHFRLPRRGEKMAHLVFLLCFCIAKKREWHPYPLRIVVPANGKAGVILAAGIMSQKTKKSQQSTALQHGGIVDSNYKLNNMCDSEMLWNAFIGAAQKTITRW